MLYGSFKSINDTTYRVEIDCSLNYEIGSTRSIQFVDDPIEIEQDVDDTFQHIIKTSAKITLLVDSYIGDYLFTANDREINVRIYKGNECIFDGFIQPQSYNQDFAEQYTEITLNCQDFLCTLENHKYRDDLDYQVVKVEAGNKTFLQMIQHIFGSSRAIYYDSSVRCTNSTNFQKIFELIGISELIVLGDEEDDLWTQEEVLNEILQFLNLHIVQIGQRFYIFNWANMRKVHTTMSFNRISGEGSATTSIRANTISVTPDLYKSDDTQVSMADVYNQIILECDLEAQEVVFDSPLEKESLSSPYTNRNQYLREHKKGKDETHDWYYQYQTNSNWILRYYHNGVVSEVNDILTSKNLYDNKGVAINQWKIPLEISQYKLSPMLCSLGKVNSENSTKDNTLRNNVKLSDYLIITINGSENKDIADTAIAEWNQITQALENEGGMMEYRSSTTAGVISPIDNNTTNYIVFSGKLMMQPPLQLKDTYKTVTIGGITSQVVTSSAEVYCDWLTATYPNEEGVVSSSITKSLVPYFEYDDFKDKYSERYGDWLFYKSQSGQDEIVKVPLLVCELKIGDKYCVETDENQFEWLTQTEADARDLETTFTLGINPAVGDYLLCKDWDISNTLSATSNVDAEGTAIPIKSTDNLSGEIRFRIISPVYSGWEQQIRRHPTCFRSTKWWTTELPVMEFIQNIYIKDFTCKLYSDNGQSNNNGNKDLIYMTDVINNSIQTKDDITFKFNSALTTAECMEKGISTTTKLSNVMYMPTNSAMKNLYNKVTTLNCKAEEMYIKDYYDEFSTPKLIVDTTLDGNATSYWNHYKFSYFPDKEFYVISTIRNLKYDTIKYKLKQI